MVEQYILYIGRSHQLKTCLRRYIKSIGFGFHATATIQKAGEKLILMPYCSLILIQFEFFNRDVFGFSSFIHSCFPHTIMMVLMTKARIHVEELLFDFGVDDVVVGHQTSSKILTKRIQAHLREINLHWRQKHRILLKGAEVDLDRGEVQRNGSCHQLRGLLADLLKYFLDNPNRIISREELKESPIWADSICSSPKDGGKTFDVNMSKLRKIIEPDPANPQIIQSVRGVGWKLVINPVIIERSLHIEES